MQERTHITRHESPAWSIGTAYANWQGLNALRTTGGHAAAVDEDVYLAERERVGRENGLYVEVSSAVGIAVARQLATTASGITVAIGTSTGLKDPALPGTEPTEITVLEPDIEELQRTVERHQRTMDKDQWNDTR